MNASPTIAPDLIAHYTAWPCVTAARQTATDIVIVPPGGELAAGFVLAETLLCEERCVRIIGDGVTFERNWPAQARSRPNLSLTELGAYRSGDVIPPTRAVQSEISRWLDDLVPCRIAGRAPGHFLWGAALQRVFHSNVELAAWLAGVVRSHRAARYHVALVGWIGIQQLRRSAHAAGGTVVDLNTPAPRGTRGLTWRLRVLAVGAAMLGAAVVHHVRRYGDERRSRARLLQLRSTPKADPRLWLTLSPDWPRINRHMIEAVAKPAFARGEAIGVLLFGRLAAGARVESNMRARTGSELWPALGPILQHLDRCPIEPNGSAASLAELFRVLARGSGISIRALWRLARQARWTDRDALQVDLGTAGRELLKLVTQDVMLALVAERATRAAVTRHDFRDRSVVLPGLVLAPAEIVCDAVLQQAGATTIDYLHGSTGTAWLSHAYLHTSSLRCVWTEADAGANRELGCETVVAGMPSTVKPTSRRERATRILLLSNFVHRDSTVHGKFPLRVFQPELLAVVPQIREDFGERFHFRWRPHPADNDALLAESVATVPGVDLSRGRELAEDCAWADIIIGSLSSAITDALMAEAPTFVFVLPHLAQTPDVHCFAAERRFFYARELREPFRQCIAQLDAGDSAALEPERRARAAMFGESGVPPSFDAWLQSAEPAQRATAMDASDHGR